MPSAGAGTAPRRPIPTRPAPPAWNASRFFAALTYVGQVHRTYLVCEAPDELILIDQHAAHERVAYARLRAAHARRQMPRQQLLFPIPIEVGETAAAVAANGEALAALGFEVAPDGPGRVLLRAVPEPLKDADPKPLLREVLARAGRGDAARRHAISSGSTTCWRRSPATASCARATSSGGPRRSRCSPSSTTSISAPHCPHGRPVLLRMPLGEIERRFGRG